MHRSPQSLKTEPREFSDRARGWFKLAAAAICVCANKCGGRKGGQAVDRSTKHASLHGLKERLAFFHDEWKADHE